LVAESSSLKTAFPALSSSLLSFSGESAELPHAPPNTGEDLK
jgi:hypothetical protein